MVQHEGVDIGLAKPCSNASLALPSGRVVTGTDEVVTFAARNLEPLRGYHCFMRALHRNMAARGQADAEVLIIGGHGTSYGAAPPRGETWKSIFWSEVAGGVDAEPRPLSLATWPYQDYSAGAAGIFVGTCLSYLSFLCSHGP